MDGYMMSLSIAGLITPMQSVLEVMIMSMKSLGL